MKLIQLPALQKATVTFIESAIVTALIAGLTAIGPVLNETGPIAWKRVIILLGYAIIVSLVLSIVAYLKAWNPVLGAIVESEATAIEKSVEKSTILQVQPSPAPRMVVAETNKVSESVAVQSAVDPNKQSI
jgi:hypothetical protein